jgi:hypothetical protein
MEACSTPAPGRGPVYIYNGVTNLKELKDVTLNGATLFFNGPFRLEDLQGVELQGANVYLNGELQVSSSLMGSKYTNGSQSTTKTTPLPDAGAPSVLSLARKDDVQVAPAPSSEVQGDLQPVKSPMRASPEALATVETKSSNDAADGLGKARTVHHQNLQYRRKARCSPFTIKDPKPEDDESTATSGKHLPPNPGHLPLSLNRNIPGGQRTRTSDPTNVHFKRPHSPVRYDAPAVVAAPVPCRLPKYTQCAKSHVRGADLLPEGVHESRWTNFLTSTPWTHDSTDDPATLTPQKRTSALDVVSTSNNPNKKPRMGTYNGFDLDRLTDKLIQEEVQRSKRARHFSDTGKSHDAIAEYEKIRKLSDQRKEIRSQLLMQGHQPLVARSTASHSRSHKSLGDLSSQMFSVPQDSPLGNVIHSAVLHEQIVQAKIKFSIAEKQLLEEKATGAPSGTISARVRFLNGRLGALQGIRNEIRNDADRMDSFRRRDLRGAELDAEDLTGNTCESSAVSPTDSEWRNRLTLCYEAVERIKPLRENVHTTKRESATLSGEEGPTIKQETSNQNRLWSIEKSGDKVPTRAPQRQVRFALTDIETCL